MAYLYKTKGLSVATNDRLRFCEHIASAIIANRDTRLDDDATRALLADNPKAETFVQDQFVGIFFADGVHARIDTIRANIDSLDGFRKDIALFALAKTCMSSQGGFGHFSASTPNPGKDGPEAFDQRFLDNVRRINALVFDNGETHTVHRADIADVLPQVTAETLTKDGGLRSGDLGRIDADGFLYITGRVKELYKLETGKYVAPAPLEEKLQLSPYIAQCVIWGSNKPYNVALVVPDMPSLKAWAEGNGVPTDAQALLADRRTQDLFRREIDSCSRDFKGFEAVREFLLEPEELTTANDMLTPTLKLKRRNVMEKYKEHLEALYS